MSDPLLTIHRGFARPAAETLARFAATPTGFVVDAMGRRGALDQEIRPVLAPGRFAGSALTVDSIPRDNLAAYAALEIAQAGDVLMVATGGDLGAAVLGDVAIGMAKNAGVIAVATDGLVRDIEGIEQVGIPVYARGLSPNSPFKNGPGTVGGTISLGGVPVSAGDVVVGDRDGLVVVPQGRVAAVLAALEAIETKEAAMERRVAEGAAKPDWLGAALAEKGVRYID